METEIFLSPLTETKKLQKKTETEKFDTETDKFGYVCHHAGFM